jgi:hypothetical protein
MKSRGEKAVAAYPLFQEERGGSIPTSPLQFEIIEIGMRLAQELNQEWHSMLPRTDLGNLLCGNTSVAYAAEFEGKYYGVGIWSQPIIRSLCNGKTIELRRLAICTEAPRYTATRMIGVMRKLIKQRWNFLEKAISYQAVDVHVGTIYKASGWIPAGKIIAARPQRFSGVNKNTRATGPLQTESRKQRWECTL